MSQWGIQVGSFLTDFLLLVAHSGRNVAYLAHQVHAVRNHDEDDTHVLGKRQ